MLRELRVSAHLSVDLLAKLSGAAGFREQDKQQEQHREPGEEEINTSRASNKK